MGVGVGLDQSPAACQTHSGGKGCASGRVRGMSCSLVAGNAVCRRAAPSAAICLLPGMP